jgi:hypothetical protein
MSEDSSVGVKSAEPSAAVSMSDDDRQLVEEAARVVARLGRTLESIVEDPDDVVTFLSLDPIYRLLPDERCTMTPISKEIPTIGPATVALLDSHGVTHAFDILQAMNRANVTPSIPGMGPAKWSVLLKWAKEQRPDVKRLECANFLYMLRTSVSTTVQSEPQGESDDWESSSEAGLRYLDDRWRSPKLEFDWDFAKFGGERAAYLANAFGIMAPQRIRESIIKKNPRSSLNPNHPDYLSDSRCPWATQVVATNQDAQVVVANNELTHIPKVLPMIGPGTLVLLAQHGVTTAYDVLAPDRPDIPGVGPAKWAVLKEWASQQSPDTEQVARAWELKAKRDAEPWTRAFAIVKWLLAASVVWFIVTIVKSHIEDASPVNAVTTSSSSVADSGMIASGAMPQTDSSTSLPLPATPPSRPHHRRHHD